MKIGLTKLLPRWLIPLYLRGFTWMKLKYFIHANQLYTLNQNKEIENSITIKYKKKKNQFGEKILTISLVKTASRLDNDLLNFTGQLQTLFNCELLKVSNKIDRVEYQLLKLSSIKDEYYILGSENQTNNLKGKIQLNKYHIWDYKKSANLLISGNVGTGKSMLLYSILDKLKQQTNEKNIFICDAKFDELLINSQKILKLTKVAKNINQILTYINYVNKIMEARYEKRSSSLTNISFKPIFLVIDEYAALQLVLDKKEYTLFNDTIKNIVLKGRAANVHLILALQRASSDSINLAIRDNVTTKIGLGNLSIENFKMLFGQNRNDIELTNKEIGEGYIQNNSINIENFRSPIIKME